MSRRQRITSRPASIVPEWTPAVIPQGHTKETISATFTIQGIEMSVSGDIAYTSPKRRSQRMRKLLLQIQRWIAYTPLSELQKHPRVTVLAKLK